MPGGSRHRAVLVQPALQPGRLPRRPAGVDGDRRAARLGVQARLHPPAESGELAALPLALRAAVQAPIFPEAIEDGLGRRRPEGRLRPAEEAER